MLRCFLKNFTDIQLSYNVVLVSSIQQSESVIHIHISTFLDSFPIQAVTIRTYCMAQGTLPDTRQQIQPLQSLFTEVPDVLSGLLLPFDRRPTYIQSKGVSSVGAVTGQDAECLSLSSRKGERISFSFSLTPSYSMLYQ